MSDDKKPEWPFEIKYAIAKWLMDHSVKIIKSDWTQTGADTADYWLELTDFYGKEKRRVSLYFFDDTREVSFTPHGQSMITLNSNIEVRIKAIEAFEKTNKRDRGELARLKRKFGEA